MLNCFLIDANWKKRFAGVIPGCRGDGVFEWKTQGSGTPWHPVSCAVTPQVQLHTPQFAKKS